MLHSMLECIGHGNLATIDMHQPLPPIFKWESDNRNTPVVAGLSQSPDFSIDAFMREVESREQGASASAKAIDGPELRRLVQVCRSPAACGLHRKTR